MRFKGLSLHRWTGNPQNHEKPRRTQIRRISGDFSGKPPAQTGLPFLFLYLVFILFLWYNRRKRLLEAQTAQQAQETSKAQDAAAGKEVLKC